MPVSRCFVGIPLAAKDLLKAVGACDVIREKDSSWRDEKWVAPQNLHITVKFLGELGDDSISNLVSLLEPLTSSSAFVLTARGVKAMPSPRRSRMLWADYADQNGDAGELAAAVEDAAEVIGIEREERPFRAHATLCRARRPRPIDQAALEAATAALVLADPFVSVGGFTLYSSRLMPTGPVYETLMSWHFTG